MIRLHVQGRPAPKGSARAITIGGHARLVPSSSNANRDAMRAWVGAIRDAAREQLPDRFFARSPLRVAIVFYVARPKGHYGTRGLKPSAPAFPSVKPDLDKLARCTLDALTGVLWDDDSRIVALNTTKQYAQPGAEGASIAVAAMDGRDGVLPDGPNDAVPRGTQEAA